MYEVCENCEETFDPTAGSCSCGGDTAGIFAPKVLSPGDPNSSDWLGTAKELMGASDNEITVGVDTPIEVSGHGDEPHKACTDDGGCDPDVNKATRGDASCGTVDAPTPEDVLKKLDAVIGSPVHESFTFDKYMDELLLAEGRQRASAQQRSVDSPLRARAAKHQERPLGRIKYGVKR